MRSKIYKLTYLSSPSLKHGFHRVFRGGFVPPQREVIVGYADRRFEDGVAVGEQRGIAIGEERGEVRGELRGRRATILNMFQRRFKSFTSAHEAVILNADMDLTPPQSGFAALPVPPVPMPGVTKLARKFNA